MAAKKSKKKKASRARKSKASPKRKAGKTRKARRASPKRKASHKRVKHHAKTVCGVSTTEFSDVSKTLGCENFDGEKFALYGKMVSSGKGKKRVARIFARRVKAHTRRSGKRKSA